MRRTMFHISVALIACFIGLTCDLAVKRVLNINANTIDDSIPKQTPQLVLTFWIEQSETRAAPGTLPAALQRIDEQYQKRCQLPTDWTGEWSTIEQLERFRECNEKWALERRAAIRAELDNYMIRY